MTEQFAAIPATDVNIGVVTDDGVHAAIKFDSPDGEAFTVALPRDKLMRLVSLCAQLAQRSPTPGETRGVEVFTTQWWTVSKGDDGRIIFGFEPEGGGMLAFGIYPDAAFQLLEVLSVALGVSKVEKPEGSAN